jgi:hypothetical protein
MVAAEQELRICDPKAKMVETVPGRRHHFERNAANVKSLAVSQHAIRHQVAVNVIRNRIALERPPFRPRRPVLSPEPDRCPGRGLEPTREDRMILVSMGEKDRLDRSSRNRSLQGLEVGRRLRSRIDHRHPLAAHDKTVRAREGVRPSIGRRDAQHPVGNSNCLAGLGVERPVKDEGWGRGRRHCGEGYDRL